MAVEKKSKSEERRWKAIAKTRRKLHKNLGLKDNDPLAILLNVLISFSYTVLFALMKTVKLLLFLAVYPDFSESSQGRNWNFSIKLAYSMLIISEVTMPIFGLCITYILVLKSIILVLCH